jgi:hypothetical protein
LSSTSRTILDAKDLVRLEDFVYEVPEIEDLVFEVDVEDLVSDARASSSTWRTSASRTTSLISMRTLSSTLMTSLVLHIRYRYLDVEDLVIDIEDLGVEELVLEVQDIVWLEVCVYKVPDIEYLVVDVRASSSTSMTSRTRSSMLRTRSSTLSTSRTWYTPVKSSTSRTLSSGSLCCLDSCPRGRRPRVL